jgi:hypothetical protein
MALSSAVLGEKARNFRKRQIGRPPNSAAEPVAVLLEVGQSREKVALPDRVAAACLKNLQIKDFDNPATGVYMLSA